MSLKNEKMVMSNCRNLTSTSQLYKAKVIVAIHDQSAIALHAVVWYYH